MSSKQDEKKEVTKNSLLFLKAKMKVAFTKGQRDKISKQAKEYAETLEDNIKSLAIDKLVINKRKRILKLGKRRDEFIDFASSIDEMKNSKFIEMLNFSKHKNNLKNYFFVDSKYVGKEADEILEMLGYKKKDNDKKDNEENNIDDSNNKNIVLEKDKEVKKENNIDDSNNKNIILDKTEVEVKKENNIDDSIKINTDTLTKDKIEQTNKKIFDYLVKSGELDAADYVLELMTRPDKTENRTSGNFATKEQIIKLSEINSGILAKLTEIEKNMIDMQDTSVESIPEKLKQVSQTNDKGLLMETEDKPNGLLGMIGSILTGLLGSFFGMDLLEFFKSMSPLKLIDKIGNLLSLGWNFIKTKVDDLIKGTWDNIIKPIIDKLPSWDSIYKFMDENVFKHLNKILEMIPSWESIGKLVTKIGDSLKNLPGMDDLKKFIGENVDKVKNAADDAWKTTKDIAGEVSDKAKSLASDSVKYVKESISNSIDNVIDNPTLAKKVSAEVGEVAAGTLGKKIPLVGLGVGAALATARANEGDYVGAGLEALSGLVSIIPVAGTAASIGIDSYLLYRDITKPEDYDEELIKKLSEDGILEQNWFGPNTLKDKDKLKDVSVENLEILLNKGDLDETSKREIELAIQARSETNRLKNLNMKIEEVKQSGGGKAEIERIYNEFNYDTESGKFKDANVPDKYTNSIYSGGVEKVGNVYLPKGDIKTILDDVAKEYNIPIGEIYATAYAESSFNPRAGANSSSAKGLFQFLTGTWNEVRRNNPEIVKKYNIGEAVKEGNDDRFDPRKSAIMYALLRKGNLGSLGKLTTGNISTDTYLAHFAGPTGAKNVINALNETPNASIATILGNKSYTANKSFLSYPDGSPMSVKDWVERLHSKKGGKLAAAYEAEVIKRGDDVNLSTGTSTQEQTTVENNKQNQDKMNQDKMNQGTTTVALETENKKSGPVNIQEKENNVTNMEKQTNKVVDNTQTSSNTIINNSNNTEQKDVRLNDAFGLKNLGV